MSPTVKGRPEGDMMTVSRGMPMAWAMVALKAGTETGFSATRLPEASVLP